MSFAEELARYPQESIRDRLAQVTSVEIERSLRKSRLETEDFLCLLSPRIDDVRLEELARRAHRLTARRFGRTVLLYTPLYLSNECCNGCRYCGFSAAHQLPRRTLSRSEIRREAEILYRQGFRHLLLLTGEAPQRVGLDYLEEAIATVRPYCGSMSLEVFPMETAGYQRMVACGVDGLTLYQETYDPDRYQQLHPYGPKRDFRNRLDAPERAGQAGLRRIGIGALLGLADGVRDVFLCGLHARYLSRTFWRSQVTVSFPRIRPAEGGFQPATRISDRQLTQFICAMRLFLPDVGLVLSTRERAALRNNLLPLGITQMSAGSCTAPGGYSAALPDSEQFSVSDTRSAAELSAYLQQHGYDPVWKDWDGAFLNAGA